jgi:transposase-like protein
VDNIAGTGNCSNLELGMAERKRHRACVNRTVSRFTLSFRDVEDLLAERGIMVSYETVRRWVNHFCLLFAG